MAASDPIGSSDTPLELAMLAELVARIAHANDAAQVAAILAGGAKWVVPCDACTLLLLEPDGERWRLLPAGATGRVDELTGPLALSLARRAVAVADALPSPAGAAAAAFAPGARSVVVLPLEADAGPLGALCLSSLRAGAYAGRLPSVHTLLQMNVAAVVRNTQLLARERAARAEAETATRTRDELLAAVSHDLKNPLTSVQATVQLMRRRAARGTLEPGFLQDKLSRLQGSVGRMTAMLNDLLDAARVQSGLALDLTLAPVDLVALARQAVAEHQSATERHRISLEAPDEPVVGAWDAARLERVLGNLLSNAVKYSPAGGEVVVRVSREQGPEGPRAVLTVRDAGVGIPAADMPHVFERFRRAGNVVGRIAGTGIGLSAVRQIVEQHGGGVSAHSREREGSTFTVWLPLGPLAG